MRRRRHRYREQLHLHRTGAHLHSPDLPYLRRDRTAMSLTDDDRQLIDRARELGPALRASSGDRERLAGWLLAELADLAERLDASAERMMERWEAGQGSQS